MRVQISYTKITTTSIIMAKPKFIFEQLEKEIQWVDDYANNVSSNLVLREKIARIDVLVKEIKSKLETK